MPSVIISNWEELVQPQKHCRLSNQPIKALQDYQSNQPIRALQGYHHYLVTSLSLLLAWDDLQINLDSVRIVLIVFTSLPSHSDQHGDRPKATLHNPHS